jgi:hypothetical protein
MPGSNVRVIEAELDARGFGALAGHLAFVFGEGRHGRKMMCGARGIFAPVRILDLGSSMLANPTAIVGSDRIRGEKADRIEMANKMHGDLESWEWVRTP